MNHSKATYRYFILAEQFFIDEKNPFYPILHEPLKRFFSYIYHHTNIWYLNFITEEEIYGYICYHRNNDFQFISFEQTIIDVKLYLFFIKSIKHINPIPYVNLSVDNYRLWTKL